MLVLMRTWPIIFFQCGMYALLPSEQCSVRNHVMPSVQCLAPSQSVISRRQC